MTSLNVLFRLSIPALLALTVTACATGKKVIGSGGGGTGGGGTSTGGTTGGTGTGGATGGTGGTGGAGGSTSTGTSTGPCVSAQDCASVADACHIGTCVNGVCVKMAANDGAACDDGKQCTQFDACDKGVCKGSMKSCPAIDDCNVGICDLALDKCVPMPANTGAPCDDKNNCTSNSFCQAGACIGNGIMDCSFLNGPCSQGLCDPAKGCVASPLNDGSSCNDNQFCTATDVCMGGKCVGTGSPCVGMQNQDCMVSTCNEVAKSCTSVPGNDGMKCDDKNACTVNTTCSNGICGNGQPGNNGTACDDGDACTSNTVCNNGACGGGNQIGMCMSGDGCCPAGCAPAADLDCGCFSDWSVGTPCNGVDFGNGCSPADTGYHFKGIFDGYACFWHQKNQAWNTTTATNFYHLAQSFNVTPGVGKCHWCDNKGATPTPLAYDSCTFYFDANNVGAWGWCAEQDPNSVGFVCIPAEGHPACN